VRTLGESSSGSGGAGGKQGDNGGKGGGGVTDLGDLILSPDTVATAPKEVPGTVARLVGDCIRVTPEVDVSVPEPAMAVVETRLTSLVESRADGTAPLDGVVDGVEKTVGAGGAPGICACTCVGGPGHPSPRPSSRELCKCKCKVNSVTV